MLRLLAEGKNMIIPETKEILRHYSFIMSTEKTKGVRSNFQKQYTLAQLEMSHDPYLERIDVSRFLSTEPIFADVRYQELVYIIDNYSAILNFANEVSYFQAVQFEKVGKKLAFVLWFQGEESSPPLVQMNIQRMRAYLPGYELVVLNDDNLSDWINTDCIPNFSYLRENFPAQASDLIRVWLLAVYGGLWLDSTVVVTEDSASFLEKVMSEKAHFVLRYGPYRIANWLMASRHGDLSMKTQFAALSLWLSTNKTFIEYFQFHTFFEVFSMLNEDFIDTSKQLRAPEAFLLSKHWSEVYPVSKIKDIFKIMPFQKMNYKINRDKVSARTIEYLYENYLNPTDDRFLNHILSLPNGKDNIDHFYISDVTAVIARTNLEIFSSVDFRKEDLVGKVSKGEKVLVECISGTIAGTPRFKIDRGYISANKKYVKKIK